MSTSHASQGSASFFRTEPDGKYFRLSGHMVYGIYSILLCRMKAALDNTYMNEYGPVPIQLNLWTLKFQFHIIFMEYHSLFDFFFLPPI